MSEKGYLTFRGAPAERHVNWNKMPKARNPQTSLYVIAYLQEELPTAPLKVGVAASPRSRLRELQTANPHRLTLVLDIPLPDRVTALSIETRCHQALADYRMSGEWFNIEPWNGLVLLSATIAEMDHEALIGSEIPFDEALSRLEAAR